jgi:hypothetical protein
LEKTARRLPGHELSGFPRFDVSKTWYCRHPFHGIHLQLGDAAPYVEERCRICGLPADDVDEQANPLKRT